MNYKPHQIIISGGEKKDFLLTLVRKKDESFQYRFTQHLSSNELPKVPSPSHTSTSWEPSPLEQPMGQIHQPYTCLRIVYVSLCTKWQG